MKKLLLPMIIIFLNSCQNSELTRIRKETEKRDSLRVFFNEYNSEFYRVNGSCQAYILSQDLEKAIIYKDSMEYFSAKSDSIYLLMWPNDKN